MILLLENQFAKSLVSVLRCEHRIFTLAVVFDMNADSLLCRHRHYNPVIIINNIVKLRAEYYRICISVSCVYHFTLVVRSFCVFALVCHLPISRHFSFVYKIMIVATISPLFRLSLLFLCVSFSFNVKKYVCYCIVAGLLSLVLSFYISV